MAKKATKAAKKKATKKAKTAKKSTAKKKTAKSKPSSKKKAVKKPIAKKAKKSVKKISAKKASKPAVKKIAAVKKVEVKKEKPAIKPLAATPSPFKKALPLKPAAKAKLPVREREESSIDSDDEENEMSPISSSKPALVKPQIRRPDPNQPKPFIGNDSRTRYSDSELVEFKEIILVKLEEAKMDYELLKNTLAHKDDHGTDDTSPTFKLLEDGSDVMSREEINHLAARQEKFILSLQNALVRIENKTYGICRVTGKLIPKERLRIVPHATLSIDAKLEQSAE